MRHFTKQELELMFAIYNESKYYDPNFKEMTVYDYQSSYVVVLLSENNDGGDEVAEFADAQEAIEYVQNNI